MTASIEKCAANQILSISFSDADAYQPIGNPTPVDYKRDERYQLALAYVYKVKGRLNKTLYNRLLKALDAPGKTTKIDESREKVSLVFEMANEYELWEEFLECFTPHWLYAQGKKENMQAMKRVEKMRTPGEIR
ncbi:MAG: hypothetical protein Q9170_002969 [Blastenia crenularia]